MKRLLIIALAVIALCVVLAVSPLANGTDEGEVGTGEGGAAASGNAGAGNVEAGAAETGGTETGAKETGNGETGAAEMPAMPAGQKVFTDARCQLCHTVYSSGIGEPPAANAEAQDAEERPDLSAAGVGRTAEWMSLYMTKKAAIDEKKHMLSFGGSDGDLAALVDWLLTLRPEEVVPPEAGKAEAVEAGKAEAAEPAKAGNAGAGKGQ